jgi:GST-like protein
MIELHSSPTPNGQKVMIMLEELGIEWKHIDVTSASVSNSRLTI